VYAPEGVEKSLSALVDYQWEGSFEWTLIGDGDRARIGDVALRFARTDHPPPTMGVELTYGGKRLVYTSDTGPEWSVDAFDAGADLVLSEATYQHAERASPIHLSARQAGEAARQAKAKRLLLTHLWPTLDPVVSVEEGSDAFGHAVTLAAPHLITHV
jgi:ribonuclease BN (tRNA processing enzyme)